MMWEGDFYFHFLNTYFFTCAYETMYLSHFWKFQTFSMCSNQKKQNDGQIILTIAVFNASGMHKNIFDVGVEVKWPGLRIV